jgi:hypothetical protein
MDNIQDLQESVAFTINISKSQVVKPSSWYLILASIANHDQYIHVHLLFAT